MRDRKPPEIRRRPRADCARLTRGRREIPMESKRSEQWQAWVKQVCEENAVTGKTGRFEPSPDDAFKLAALQWWTHTIGRIAIEIYATDRRQFDRMSRILSDA